MTAKKYLLITCVSLLTACAPPKPVIEVPQNNLNPGSMKASKAQTPATVSSFEIRGALAAKAKSKGWSASMHWLQEGPNSYHIRLMGPLGSGTVLINKQGNTITFQDGSKKITSNDAASLLLKQTGIKLPVNNLYYWVRGLPAPGAVQSTQRNSTHYLKQLKQNGYVIDFNQYTSISGLILPSNIRLEGNGIMIKVIIKYWKLKR